MSRYYDHDVERAVDPLLRDNPMTDDVSIPPRAELKPTDSVTVRPHSCSVHRGKTGVIRSTNEPGRLSVLVVFPPSGNGGQVSARFAPGELRRNPRP